MPKKARVLIFLAVACLVILLLAISISNLTLLSGQPFSLPQETREDADADTETPIAVPPEDKLSETLFRVWLIVTGVVGLLAIIYAIFVPRARKHLLRNLLLVLFLFAVYYLAIRNRSELVDPEEQAQMLESPIGVLPPEASVAEFVADPPQWLLVATTIGLALFVAALLVGSAWIAWRVRMHRRRDSDALRRLAREAQDAIDALEEGADLRNAVIRCYFEMSRILDEQQNLRRQSAMTPREFEERLEGAGVPAEPVRQLTRLFERARYGAGTPSEDEERQAVASLTAIANFYQAAQ